MAEKMYPTQVRGGKEYIIFNKERGLFMEKRVVPNMPVRKAIRLHCLECNGESKVRPDNDCVSSSCFLYQHRPWDGPGRNKRIVPEKQKKAAAARMRKMKRGEA